MVDRYESSTRLPELTQQLAEGAPQSPIYIAPEDVLVVNVTNSAVGATFRFFGRLLRVDGVTVPLEQVLQARTDGVGITTTIRLAEGYLLSAGVVDVNGTAQRGQCYVHILLVRGELVVTQQYAYLTTGYVSALFPLIWPWAARNEPLLSPPGYAETVTPAGATGTFVDVTVPARRAWRVNNVFFSILASAAAPTRLATVQIYRGAQIVAYAESAYPLPATLGHFYSFGRGLKNQSPEGTGVSSAALPEGLVLVATQFIRIGAIALQAGDVIADITVSVESFAAAV